MPSRICLKLCYEATLRRRDDRGLLILRARTLVMILYYTTEALAWSEIVKVRDAPAWESAQ